MNIEMSVLNTDEKYYLPKCLEICKAVLDLNSEHLQKT